MLDKFMIYFCKQALWNFILHDVKKINIAMVKYLLSILLLFLFCETVKSEWRTNCSDLQPGQYLCLDLNIDPNTQQPKNCNEKTQLANVTCVAAPGINCTESGNSNFTLGIPCKYTNGYSFETALLLSVFLGMFGVDRFYLGYYAIGLAKFCTLGFLFLGQLIDIILIATQTVGPADGSHYIISYFGAGINIVSMDNETYRMPQDDWRM